MVRGLVMWCDSCSTTTHKSGQGSPSIKLPAGPILEQRFVVQTGEFVQILHSGGNHWITVYTVGMDSAHIFVYNSLLGTLPVDAKKQIASLIMTYKKNYD